MYLLMSSVCLDERGRERERELAEAVENLRARDGDVAEQRRTNYFLKTYSRMNRSSALRLCGLHQLAAFNPVLALENS